MSTSSYTLTQKELTSLKRHLTKARNKVNQAEEGEAKVTEAKQLLRETYYAFGIFKDKGYPDDWSRWERAKDDAQMVVRMGGRGRV